MKTRVNESRRPLQTIREAADVLGPEGDRIRFCEPVDPDAVVVSLRDGRPEFDRVLKRVLDPGHPLDVDEVLDRRIEAADVRDEPAVGHRTEISIST